MDACNFLLGRPWQYDRKVTYYGLKTTYTFQKDGVTICLLLIQPMLPLTTHVEKPSMLIAKAQLEEEVRISASVFTLVMSEESEEMEFEVPKEVKSVL